MGNRGRQLRRFLRPPTRLMEPLPFDALAAIAIAGRALFNATCVGSPAPIVHWLFQWMNAAPRVGDLLVETSTWHREAFVIGSVGLFDRHETLTVCQHEAADANHPGGCGCPPDERYTERYTWLRTGVKGRDPVWRHRWHNASFIRIPRTAADLAETRELCNAATGTAGITRETLIGSLTEAGFRLRDRT